MKAIEVQVWSDIACPWCFVGKRRLEAALAQLGDHSRVEVHWRAFELDPAAPKAYPSKPSYVERLASKYGLPLQQAEQMIERMRRVGVEEGIEFAFERIQAGSTFDAHRLLCFAVKSGFQHALKERLLGAYFSEGALISDHGVLVSLAAEVGLEPDAASAVLASGAWADQVRKEEQLASELGVRGVPFFAIGQHGVSGAQPSHVLLQALERAAKEAPDIEPSGSQATARPEPEAAELCTPERCE